MKDFYNEVRETPFADRLCFPHTYNTGWRLVSSVWDSRDGWIPMWASVPS